jgi:carbonic anhydrase
MSHHCKNIIIHCMDFRLQDDIAWHMKSKGIMGDCDVVSVAGVMKDLVSPEKPEYRDFILKQVRISHDLHNMRRVILLHHTDCGAYGGHKAFASEAEEDAKHVTDMREAAAIIRNAFPDVEVVPMLIKMTDSGNRFVEL